MPDWLEASLTAGEPLPPLSVMAIRTLLAMVFGFVVAAVHRLTLIAENDPRVIAIQIKLPVYSLTGFFDPIVPWWRVRPWLRTNCPGYRAGKIIACADHNVLGTAPQVAAEIICRWLALHTVVDGA